jgi:hypothetical protein
MFAILIVALVFFLAVAVASAVAARTVGQAVGRQGFARPPEDSELNVRLTRIEEAIDAMAEQIERLAEQQRVLLLEEPANRKQETGKD